ncbi:MAG TPA: PspA/IM30 family protein [Bacillota bacterium]
MNLLERVSTLIRANLNDLIDRAEDPEKMIKQVLLDMQNQLIQVKTQVAIAIADERKLEKRHGENVQAAREWEDKAGLAVDKAQDDLAKGALERRNAHQAIADGFKQQWEEQKQQVQVLKQALSGLEAKITEAEAKKDLLIAQNRRALTGKRVAESRARISGTDPLSTFRRMEEKITDIELKAQATQEMHQESLEEKFAKLEKDDLLDRQLAELKVKRSGKAGV